jgi:GDP-D-mannose dehydratase
LLKLLAQVQLGGKAGERAQEEAERRPGEAAGGEEGGINPDLRVATGETHTGQEFLERAFAHAGIDDWERLVESDPRMLRPAEVDHLIGDASKAKAKLGWEPKVRFEELVRIMVDADLKAERDKL